MASVNPLESGREGGREGGRGKGREGERERGREGERRWRDKCEEVRGDRRKGKVYTAHAHALPAHTECPSHSLLSTAKH